MADVKEFRKKPVVIQAIQWDGTLSGMDEILSVFTDIRTVAKTSHPPTNTCSFWKIGTLEGSHEVSAHDFVIRGVKGEYYPCKPDIFFMTYEPATATPPADAALADGVTDVGKYDECLRSLVRQVALMMDDCTEHENGEITIDCDISQGFLRRIYDLLDALEDAGCNLTEPPAFTATAAAAALRARAAPEGHVMVPVEPDVNTLKRMHEAYWGGTTSNHWHENSEPLWRKTYIALLAASKAGEGK